MRAIEYLAVLILLGSSWTVATAADETRIVVQTGRLRQTFDGLGAGAIFYEGHITSLAARQKIQRQEQLYDDMFAHVPTRYLQLMIRETHEPQNDNDDPWKPAFDDKNFEYCKHALQIAKAALQRRPDIQLYATLYTPPPWMKTNNDASGGGAEKATLKDGLELELAEYVWAFLEFMHRGGATIQYLSIANEPDWPHTQPGYFLTPQRHTALLKTVASYLDKMALRYPQVPRPKLVGPNTLGAPSAALNYIPPLVKGAINPLDVFGSHDYDPRGDRWGAMRKLAGAKPVWLTEWCARDKDDSPGQINSATLYGRAMHEAFKGGANVFLAYDWVYPPSQGGEALIRVDWGNDYQLTKPYHLFRQWAEPLMPGMHLVEGSISGAGASADGQPGVKPTAFLSADGMSLVVHVDNVQDKEAAISLKIAGRLSTATSAARIRTSASEDAVAIPKLTSVRGGFADALPARSMTTYRIEANDR